MLICAAAVLLLGGCGLQAPKGVTTQAGSAGTIYNVTLFFAIVVFVGVVGLLLVSIARFRKRPDDDGTMPVQTHGNTAAEIVWTVIPTMLVFVLFGMSLAGIRSIDKPVKQSDVALEVVVRGFQWNWTFDYGRNAAGRPVLVQEQRKEDGTVSPPEMVVPVGRTVHVVERSDNVIHSFFVPKFLFKRDVVPGRQNEFNFKVTTPGRYHGQCAEYCGTNHAAMNFTVVAVGYDDFYKWFQEFKPPVSCPKGTSAAPRIESVAQQTAFQQSCVVVPAGRPVTITFHNGGGLQHNVAVARGDSPTAPVVKAGKIIQAGDDRIPVPALPKGDYTFFCQVHPQMSGTYRAE